MVDVMLMANLLRALPPKAGLLLVGNIDQLPSVGRAWCSACDRKQSRAGITLDRGLPTDGTQPDQYQAHRILNAGCRRFRPKLVSRTFSSSSACENQQFAMRPAGFHNCPFSPKRHS